MRCTIARRRAAPRVKACKGFADHTRLGAHTHTHTHCRRTSDFRVAPKGHRLQSFGRPDTHHVCCSLCQCRTAPNIQGLQGLHRTRLLRTYTCVLLKRGLHPGRNLVRASPTNFCCEHTHVCCRMNRWSVAPKGQRLQRFVRPVAARRFMPTAARAPLPTATPPSIPASPAPAPHLGGDASSTFSSEPRPLRNISNFCYVNSVISALIPTGILNDHGPASRALHGSLSRPELLPHFSPVGKPRTPKLDLLWIEEVLFFCSRLQSGRTRRVFRTC